MSCRQLSRFWHFLHSAFQVCDVIAPTTSAYPSAILALQYVSKHLFYIYTLNLTSCVNFLNVHVVSLCYHALYQSKRNILLQP